MTQLNQKLLFTLGIAFLGLMSLGIENVFAAPPEFTGFVADDPDDLDNTYSNGDTLTITFDIPTNASGTMSQGAIDGNFTFSNPAVIGTTYSGVWSDSSTLVITVTDVGVSTLTLGTTDVAGAGTTTIADADGGNPDLINNNSGPILLSGDFGLFVALLPNGGGSGCSVDCEPPTLGVNNYGKRMVDNGFTYNGNPIDVEYFFTPYPLMTVNVAQENIAEFKIFDNLGADNIKHFELAFGLGKGNSISKSQAIIKWDKQMIGGLTTIIDPDNILENVKVETTNGKCKADSERNDCLLVTVIHTFRGVPDFNIVGTQVWDERINSWQNFYNHGIQVQGDSLNPAKEITVLDHDGFSHILTLSDKTTAIDEEGKEWNLVDGFWDYDQVITGKIVDELTSRWYDRNHAIFETYKQGQALIAKQTLMEILNENIPNTLELNNDSQKIDVPINITIMQQIQKAQLKYQTPSFELAKSLNGIQ